MRAVVDASSTTAGRISTSDITRAYGQMCPMQSANPTDVAGRSNAPPPSAGSTPNATCGHPAGGHDRQPQVVPARGRAGHAADGDARAHGGREPVRGVAGDGRALAAAGPAPEPRPRADRQADIVV